MKAALLCFALVACGPSARQRAIATTYAATDTAAGLLVTYDAQHQHELVLHAKDEAEKKAALANWRENRTKAEVALAAAFRAEAAASILNTDQSFQSMVAAALAVSQLLRDLGIQ